MVYITGSAIKTKNYIVYGLRHSDCFKVLSTLPDWKNENENSIQGFITSENKFVERDEALEIILNNDQEIRGDRGFLRGQYILISEDLW